MEKYPLVSVLVPVYNQEAYVGKCLKSICNQTYKNLEVIVINDGSIDGSLDIINKYTNVDKRIRVVSKKNEGLAYARRDGYKLAQGEYVINVDSDDWIPETAIQDLMEPAILFGTDVVIGKFYRQYLGGMITKTVNFSPDLPINRIIKKEELFSSFYISFFGKNILPVNECGRIYRKSIIDLAMQKETLFNENCLHMGEDAYFNLILFPYINSLYVIDKIVYNYRYGGMTSSYNKYFTELFYFGDVRVHLLDKFCYEKGFFPLFFEYKNNLYCELLQRIQFFHEDRDKIMDFVVKELNSRYLVERMTRMCGKNAPDSLKPLVNRDYDAIYAHALELEKANKWKFRIRELFYYLTSALNLF